MHKLYDLKKMLCKELEEYGSKELSAGSLDVIDKLAHSIKNIDKVIMAEENYSGDYSRGSYSMGGGSYARGSYADGGSYMDSRRSEDRESYDSYSGKRDSMGRYSRDEKMVAELRELQRMANNELAKEEFEKLIHMVQSM